jgi:hypothetical protein
MIGSGYSLTAGLGEDTIAQIRRPNFAEWLKLNEQKLIEFHKRKVLSTGKTSHKKRREIRKAIPEEIIVCLLCFPLFVNSLRERL